MKNLFKKYFNVIQIFVCLFMFHMFLMAVRNDIQFTNDELGNETSDWEEINSELFNLMNQEVKDTVLQALTLQKSRSKASKMQVFGKTRNYTSFLTIAISSVKRPTAGNTIYLLDTLKSIVDMTTLTDKLRVVVVIYLAGDDTVYNNYVTQMIVKKYKYWIDMGFIQIVQTSKDYYPSLSHLKRNFGDHEERVKWRAKQVADFAFMFKYSENISQYYIQLEDDVLCHQSFVTTIEHHIKDKVKQKVKWSVLDFSGVGFIGILVKSKDLDKLSSYMLAYYEEMPVDWLIDYFRLSMKQPLKLFPQSLFQHRGKCSSFNKTSQKLKSPIAQPVRKFRNNPLAYVHSTMVQHTLQIPENCYLYNGGFFWATDPKVGDTLTILFLQKQNLSRILVETGNNGKGDILRNGTISVSKSAKVVGFNTNKAVECIDPEPIAVFVDGVSHIKDLDTKISGEIQCVVITVISKQTKWIAFKNIQMFRRNQILKS